MREEKRILRCLNCGQEFEPTCHKTRQKFCCDACRQKYQITLPLYADGLPRRLMFAMAVGFGVAGRT